MCRCLFRCTPVSEEDEWKSPIKQSLRIHFPRQTDVARPCCLCAWKLPAPGYGSRPLLHASRPSSLRGDP
ncbi:hypothetical protein AAFF_G00060510 [Aldrovandia affinis]|uniref:Uncharacterized protein n=1 Tax=Aldrovandia affinis TaxID=143900 RepID=A0AAD7S088_9TELE|nr:hypothetical protein AAFF_G00060510 [Aldrovandia affinis]